MLRQSEVRYVSLTPVYGLKCPHYNLQAFEFSGVTEQARNPASMEIRLDRADGIVHACQRLGEDEEDDLDPLTVR